MTTLQELNLVTPPLHPGEVVAELIDDWGTTAPEVSRSMGRPESELQSIIDGRRDITGDVAAGLSVALELPVYVFENLQANYDDMLARYEERQRAADEAHLLDRFPVKPAMRLGWLPKFRDARDQVLELREFLSLDRLNDFRPQLSGQFRSTGRRQHSKEALEMWLRMGVVAARSRTLPSFDEVRFRQALVDIRGLTRHAPEVFLPQVRDLCGDAGVGFVMVENLPNVGASGATWWDDGGSPWIQINPRGNYLDPLWFTIFHEAGHVLGGRRDGLIHFGPLPRASKGSDEEAVANRFAEEQLIPVDRWDAIAGDRPYSAAKVQRWADELDIHPGIIVSRLHHEKLLPRTHLHGLRSKFTQQQRRALSFSCADRS